MNRPPERLGRQRSLATLAMSRKSKRSQIIASLAEPVAPQPREGVVARALKAIREFIRHRRRARIIAKLGRVPQGKDRKFRK
jgi:hypothetical protein